jgi:hypothetical protein
MLEYPTFAGEIEHESIFSLRQHGTFLLYAGYFSRCSAKNNLHSM